MLIAIDESGDFAPGSRQLSFFVAVLLQQQDGGLNTKQEQFQAWLARMPKERSNKHGEIKGSELTDAQLLDFAQNVISPYPPVKIEYVRFCPAENPEEVMQAHKAKEVASVYRIAEQTAADGNASKAREYTNMAIWYKNASRMNYLNYMKMVLLRRLILKVFYSAIGLSILIELLHRDPQSVNLLNITFKIDRDFVRGPDPETFWKELLRSSFRASRDGIPVLDEWNDDHPFLKKYPLIEEEFLDFSDVFKNHCAFYDSHVSFEVQIADITALIINRYFNRGAAREAYAELWATTSAPSRPTHLRLQ
jgi:hypothetical protein